MNEVRPTQVTTAALTSVVSRAASSQRGDGVSELPLSGKALPVEGGQPEKVAEPRVEIEQVVTEMNQYVQSVQRDLHFSVDEASGMTVIRVRDKESGELIRQIPEDIFLNMAQNLKENQPLHLFDAHG